MKKKAKKQAVRASQSSPQIEYIVISEGSDQRVIFECETMPEGLAFIEGRRGGVLCKLLSLCRPTVPAITEKQQERASKGSREDHNNALRKRRSTN